MSENATIGSRMDGACEFLCDQFSTDDPVLAVRMAANGLVGRHPARIPVNLDSLLCRRGVTIGLQPAPDRKDAVITPTEKGFALSLGGRFSRGRHASDDHDWRAYAYRFALAHEIMETFFFD